MELLGGCAMNEINICKEVGAKIRYFRKLQGYTLESFATILHRSKSVLSQYERGEISIDLLTLQQISNALGVSIGALIDNYWNASNLLITSGSANQISMENMRQEYIYTYFSHAKAPILRAHQLCYNESKTHAAIYTYSSEKLDGASFEYFYPGKIVCGQSFTRLLLSNPLIEDDLLFLEFPARFRGSGAVLGFLSTYSVGSCFPLAAMALLSSTIISDREWLISCLSYNRDDMKLNRQCNCFFVNQEKNHFLHENMELHKKLHGKY